MKQHYILFFLLCSFIMISCSQDNNESSFEEQEEQYDINEVSHLTINSNRGLRNQEFTLMLSGVSGDNYTSLATFYLNGSPLNGNVFSSASEGQFEVYATYDLAGTITTTETETIEIFTPKRKVLFEDYTGTWCGYCTAMTARVEEMQAESNDVAVVAIHVGNDPWSFPDRQELFDFFEVIFIPTGFTNREYFYGDAWPVEVVLDTAGEDTDVTIAMASNVSGQDLTIDIKVLSGTDMTTNKLLVYLLEDGLLYNQANSSNGDPNSQYYQMGNPIVNFEHNDVLRNFLTDIFGDPIPVTAAFTSYEKSFNMTLPSDYDINNLELVVAVVNEDETVRNVQYARVGQAKSFE